MSWLSRLFRKEEPGLSDFSVLGVDMHSHFIPGIDDGSKSLDDSEQMIRGMVELGFHTLVTTPHIMSDFYRNTPENILGGLEAVRSRLKDVGIAVELRAAAEYYCDADFLAKIESAPLLTLKDNYVLFEVSYLNPPDNLNDVIFALQSNGYKPVLAHPERYPFWFSNFSHYETMRSKGVLLQLNINSLTGHYSPATKKMAEQMIDRNMFDFVGSDCHHMGHQNLMRRALREPKLRKVVESGMLKNALLV